MLRVLHVAKFYPPVAGGMERVVQSLCSVARDRLDSRVLAFGSSSRTVEERVDGVDVTRVGTIGAAGSVPISPGFFAALSRARADVLLLHEPNPWALLAYTACRPRIPLAIWYHSDVVRPALQYTLFYAPVARAAYRDARRIVVSSPRLAERSTALGPVRDRVTVIPFGLDSARWQPTESIATRAAEIRQSVGRPLVLFAGRLVPYKGVDVLLQAVAPLPIAVAIAGDGPMRADWTSMSGRSGGTARIAFTGEIDDDELRAYMMACDLFVLPSVTRAEAFGYVQLEAMASGKPVVSTDLPSGVPWVNRHGETGLIVPPGNPAALRAAIECLVGDGALRARMGAAGRARVEREFTLSAMGERLVSLCHEVAGGPAR